VRISYINGICVKNDAISKSIQDEITWLSSEGTNDVRLYAYACDDEGLPFNKVSDLRDIAFDQHFQSSDLVVFHFGVFYQLFNLLPIAPMRAKRLVVFHNITPKQFVSVENHPTIDKSFQQKANIMFADHVVCDSHTNLDVLQAAGIHTPATVLPLAVHIDLQTPESKPSAVDGVIRLAFVGRFVHSKGPGELLEALHWVLQRNHSVHITLDMVGNLSFSDDALLEEIRKTAEAMQRSFGERLKITIHGNATSEVKHQILHDADLFVLPTYHEGFCVPILEALAAGCKVIAYENSNTPAISGGLAKLTPTGDVEALSCAIEEAIEEITSSAWRRTGIGSYTEYARRARQYILQYSPERVKRQFLHFIEHLTSPQP
jgi:glycosyltransferase involved in cell wall biosynthesis